MAKKPEGFDRHSLEIPFSAISFDMEAFDNMIRSDSVMLEIYSALLCPIGISDPNDVYSHMDHTGCSNGFLYEKVGEVRGAFMGNNSKPDFEGIGLIDDSTAYLTIERFYDCPADKPVLIGHYYKIYIKDSPVVTVNSEVIESHQSGVDRLSYPVVEVLRLKDARGKDYKQGDDFTVVDGMLHWCPGKAPGYDTQRGRGVCFSIQYSFKPHYFVKQIIHEVRVVKEADPITGEVSLIRAPYQVLAQREYAFHAEDRVKRDKGSEQDVASPRDGSFGPR